MKMIKAILYLVAIALFIGVMIQQDKILRNQKEIKRIVDSTASCWRDVEWIRDLGGNLRLVKLR